MKKDTAENKKFRFSQYGSTEHEYLSLGDLLSGKKPSGSPDEASQWLGIRDAGKQDIYEGDALELCITKEIMDMKESSFPFSNLGKKLQKMPEVLSCVLFMTHGNRTPGCHYELYFVDYDLHAIKDDDGNPYVQADGCGSWFPQYLVEKGARIITDTFADTSFLRRFEKHSLWKKDEKLLAEYTDRYGGDL